MREATETDVKIFQHGEAGAGVAAGVVAGAGGMVLILGESGDGRFQSLRVETGHSRREVVSEDAQNRVGMGYMEVTIETEVGMRDNRREKGV